MKKGHRKNAVHPTRTDVSDHFLSFLPTAILSLTVALSNEEKEVLAYLISCSSTNFSHNRQKPTVKEANHPPYFHCSCFRCYMSYWVKWDSSPKREVIHDIIDAFEDSLVKKEKNNIQRKKGKSVKVEIGPVLNESNSSSTSEELSSGESSSVEEVELEKGSVRKFVSFLGDRIWSVWR